MLPEHVLETLKQSTCPVQPFSTTSDAVDDGGKVPGEDDDTETTKKIQKKKTNPCQEDCCQDKGEEGIEEG